VPSPPRVRTGIGRLVPLVALGAGLARRGPMPIVSLGVTAFTVLVFVVLGMGVARRGGDAPVHTIPLVASSALAWGGGFLLAFSASANALRRDRAEGIRHLFVTRTASIRGYLVARAGGLAALLACVLGGGTLLTGAVSILAAGKAHAVLRTMQATAAGVAFAIAFALVMAPVALAALGTRTRLSGYFFLFAILVAPEIVATVVTGPIPAEVTELLSLPSALAALRGSLAPGTADALRFVRAVVALAVFAAAAVVLLRREVVVLELEREAT